VNDDSCDFCHPFSCHGSERKDYIYTGHGMEDIPRDVSHVRVHASVKVIDAGTFYSYSRLRWVDLCEGLEKIGNGAFRDCGSLLGIVIPSSVKVIDHDAFRYCSQLRHVDLGKGLVEIWNGAFCWCTSLRAIIIPPSVKLIDIGAFSHCWQLRNLDLGNGLEKIGDAAFFDCRSLRRIVITPSVEVIDIGAFRSCPRLMSVALCEGVRKIGKSAFRECTSLRRIAIPPSVRVIDDRTFDSCSGLMCVELCDGLETIGKWAFRRCTSLRRIVIPSTVKKIHEKAFENCSQLKHVQFCDGIEQFVAMESIRNWWHRGVHERSLRAYSFIAQHNVPERFGLVQIKKWKADIQDMLGRIPAISTIDLNSYFYTIDSKLATYENLSDAPTLLELAIWKSKMTETCDWNKDTLGIAIRMQCRVDSITMVKIIVPNVLNFLYDEDDTGYNNDDIGNNGGNDVSEVDAGIDRDNLDDARVWLRVLVESNM
jgi:hypothetical protein